MREKNRQPTAKMSERLESALHKNDTQMASVPIKRGLMEIKTTLKYHY